MSEIRLKTAIVYPDSDGAPMAESDQARKYLTYSTEALELYFKNRDDVYVSGNLFIYYEQGNPSAVIAPDVFVIFGVANHPRMSYKTWEENNHLPNFILEITSKTTKTQDTEDKPLKYARLGVKEYFQYDPSGDYLQPQLKGYTLVQGKYAEKTSQNINSQDYKINSEILGLELHLISGQLRFYDPKTAQFLGNYQEETLARQQAEIGRQQAELARQQAELAYQQEQLARREAIPNLMALGLNPEQIATALNLSLEEVNQYLQK